MKDFILLFALIFFVIAHSREAGWVVDSKHPQKAS